MNPNFYCIIMAGGIGSRFWPLSRNEKPKQFLDILGTGRTFLQQTFDRFAQIINPQNILIVTSASYGDLIKEQLPDIAEENILLEPSRKNTAPCIAYATYKLKVRNPNATVVVTPSDHYISNEAIFLESIMSTLNYASENNDLLTLGIKPSRPETAYGYIQLNTKDTMNIDGNIAYKVKTFTEKPDSELAHVFMESGEFLWNSGIFIWHINSISQELEHWLPEIAFAFKDFNAYYTDIEQTEIESVYDKCQPISIDYGVMEKTLKASVFLATFGWSDLGTWESFFIHSNKDDNGNTLNGEDIFLENVNKSIIYSTENQKLISIVDLENMMVINTDDVLVICPRDDVKLKNLTTDLSVRDKNIFF